MALTIDPEFADQIPPLTDEEYNQLEENILAEGAVINPLIVWDGIIVDGHNRFRILQAHPEITFKVHEKVFSNRYEAIAWICKNQLGRRNLTPAQYKYLVGKRYEAEKALRGGSQTRERDSETWRFTSSGQNDHLRTSEKTSERIAKEIGKGEKYVRRAEEFAKGIDAAEHIMPGIKPEILSGAIHPPDKDVIAIARATPEKRKALSEQLRKPRVSTNNPSSAAHSSAGNSPKGNTPKRIPSSLASIQAISEQLDSESDHPRSEVDTAFIVCELNDALQSMIFRWKTCLDEYSRQASTEECQAEISILAERGIQFLQKHKNIQGEQNHE